MTEVKAQQETVDLKRLHRRYPVEFLPEALRTPALELSESVQAPIELAVQAVLSTASTCYSINWDTDAFDGVFPLTLAFLSEAQSGDRKSTIDDKASKGLDRALSEYNQQLLGVEDESERRTISLFTTDPTAEGLAKAMQLMNVKTIRVPDAASFLHGHAMKDANQKKSIADFAVMWDGKAIVSDRSGRDASRSVEQPRLGMNMMTQEPFFLEFLRNRVFMEQGLAARLFYSSTETMQGSRFVDPQEKLRLARERKQMMGQKGTTGLLEFHEAMYTEAQQAFRNLKGSGDAITGDFVPFTRKVVALDPDVDEEAYMHQWHLNNIFEQDLKTHPEWQHISWMNRRLEHVMRLSAIFALASGQEQHSMETLENAANLVKFYAETYLTFLECAGESEVVKEAVELLTFLAERPSIKTVRDLMRSSSKKWSKSAKATRELLRVLDDRQKLRIIETETGRGDFTHFAIIS